MNIKSIFKYVFTFFIVLIIFILYMISGCLFSSEWIAKNVNESAEILIEEGKFYKAGFSVIDNVADPLMINEAYSVDCKNPIFSAMSVRKNYKEGVTKEQLKDLNGELITFQIPKKDRELVEINGKLYSKDTRNNYAVLTQDELEKSMPELIKVNGETFYITEYNTGKELKSFIDGNVDISVEYARYWHGYLPLLRVLLVFFNIQEIRVLLILFFICLLVYLLVLLNREFGPRVAIIFGVSLLWHDYLMIGYSLQCSPLFLLMMISSIIFLKKKRRKIEFDFSRYIFTIGMCTSFVDYLTCPIITLGILLIINILFLKKNNVGFKEIFVMILKNSILWAMGYALTWISKWVIYDLLFNGKILKVGIAQFLYRASRSNIKTEMDSLWNIMILLVTWVLIGCILLALIVFPNTCGFKIKKISKANLSLLIVSIMPFAWHFVLKNHTLLHWYFSFRDFIILQIVILNIINEMVIFKSERVKNEKNF